MKIILSIFLNIFLTTSIIFSQEVSDSDPTYFKVDYADISSTIQWQGKTYQNLGFRNDSIPSPYGLPLKIKSVGYNNIAVKGFTPFLLDTGYFEHGYCYFHPNPDWFVWLQQVDLTNSISEKKVGQLKMDIKISKNSVRQLFQLLLEFGVLETYFHLYAELIIKSIHEAETMVQIEYNCVFHYCTNDCYDPSYTFILRFDKQTKEILVIK